MKANLNQSQIKMNEIMNSLAECVDLDPSCEKVQTLIAAWHEHLNTYHYECNLKMFESLGKLYISDQSAKEKLDKYRPGTAKLMSEAICFFVKDKL